MKKQLLLVMLCAGMFCGTEAKGQEAERLSGYVQAERFTKEKLNTMLFSTSVDPHWFRKGSSFWYEYKTGNGKVWYVVDPVAKTKRPLFDLDDIAAQITEIVKDPFTAQQLPIQKLEAGEDGRTFTFQITSSQEAKKDSTDKDKGPKKEIFFFSYDYPTRKLTWLKEKKKETKNPPLLYNLAELQNDCSKMFKISPDETLKVVQELYEKKLVTYPRTDARVLSTAVAKEIYKNINGLMRYEPMAGFAKEAMNLGSFKGIAKTRYVNDKQITDHYAIIPTGQGLGNLRGLSPLGEKVYQVVCRRFLSIFYPAAIYQKYSLVLERKKEQFFASFKVLSEPGYLKVADVNLAKKSSIQETFSDEKEGNSAQTDEKNAEIPKVDRTLLLQVLADLKKNDILTIADLKVKEGETSPPKRYTSGSMILAMENAGQLIEDEELRAQIKGSGIGTSATRAEILKKLVSIKYLSLNQKTQVITPSLLGEMVYEVVDHSIRQLLNPELTASWEKGLTYVAEGSITSDEYMEKLERFVAMRTVNVTRLNNQYDMRGLFDAAAAFYKTKKEN